MIRFFLLGREREEIIYFSSSSSFSSVPSSSSSSDLKQTANDEEETRSEQFLVEDEEFAAPHSSASGNACNQSKQEDVTCNVNGGELIPGVIIRAFLYNGLSLRIVVIEGVCD